MPAEMEQKELMPEATAADEVLPPGSKGAVPCDSYTEVRDGFKLFVDGVHQKASMLVTWIQAAENLNTDRSKKLLDCVKRLGLESG